MKKRILSAFLCAVMVITATACGEDTPVSESTDTAASATTPAASDTTAEQTTASAAEKQPDSTEAVTEPTSAEVAEEAPAEEAIVPLEIIPQSIPKTAFKCSEWAMMLTLICSETGHFYDYNYIGTWFSERSEINSPEPATSFINDWGCFPSVINSAIQSADEELVHDGNWQSLGEHKPSDLVTVTDLTGISTEDLYKSIDSGTPVAVWITEYLLPILEIAKVDDIIITDSHECTILVGYSDTSVMVWSPLQDDYATYDREKFEQIFEELGSFALTITAK